ncbi:MAG TPA: hypothetical protein PLV45_19090, partial [bacterium]|nr:hypothetical protein [bacterium]
ANQAGSHPLPPCSMFNEIGNVDLDKGKYGCNDTIEITVSDGSLPGAGTQDVEISSDTETTPETITLVETPADSGTFIGTIATTTNPPSPGNGILSVAAGDEITVLYIDADDGQGGVNIPRYDYADVDCTAPVISNVAVESVSAYEALITWDTNEPCSGEVIYGTTVPPTMTAVTEDLATNHSVLLEDLDDCAYHVFKIVSYDEASNMAEDDNGGAYYNFTTLEITIMLEANMDSDPGWTYENQWAWGVPQGNSGDPSSGFTGSNVVGYNLSGSYTNNMPETYCTTTSFDCTEATDVFLSYYHWLGVESSTWDHASVDVSPDGGSSWTQIWDHSGSSQSPSSWSYAEFDISAIAAGNANVKIRWVMGTTDSSVVYCGWNIDDVLVSFTSECNQPTPTPNCIHHGDVTLDGDITAGDA